MRPSLLNPLFAPVTTLPGIGPKLAPYFDRLVGEPGRPARVVDVLFHLPHSILDRSARPKLYEAPPDALVTVGVRVEAHRPPPPAANPLATASTRCVFPTAVNTASCLHALISAATSLSVTATTVSGYELRRSAFQPRRR